MLKYKNIITILFALISTQHLMSQIEINGKITDSNGNPLSGVIISIHWKDRTTISNESGEYKIVVYDTNSVICYNFPNYKERRIRVSDKVKIDVLLNKKEIEYYKLNDRKPIIYLYPLVETEILFKIDDTNLILQTPYPKIYNWNIYAYPNGNLKIKNEDYLYLFGVEDAVYGEKETTYETGFIIQKDSIISFLQRKLSELGLKPNEYEEFIVYWTPFLKQNNWNFIHFRIGTECEVISKNIVNPLPNTEIRVFMDFKKIDKPFELKPQKIITPVRTGFTIVELGGVELNQFIRIKKITGGYLEI